MGPILVKHGVQKDLVTTPDVNPRDLLKRFFITKPLPVDQSDMDVAMNYKEVQVEEDTDLDMFYQGMNPGTYVYDAIIPEAILQRFQQYVPSRLQGNFKYNILSQIPGMNTSYAYFGTDCTGTGIHWDLFSSIGVNQMVAIYSTGGKQGLVADSCTKQ